LLGPLEFCGGQFALLLGYWFVVWARATARDRPVGETPIGLQYLWWMSVPTFGVFASSSLLKSGQINWPVAAYLSGAVLTAGWLADKLSQPSARWARRFFACTLVIGFVLTALAHNSGAVVAVVSPLLPRDTTANPKLVRKIDPAARLKGWGHLGRELESLREQVRAADGQDPLLAGVHWDEPGLFALYSPDHPQAYSLGLLLRFDRHSQYDLWHPNPVGDAQAFHGRTFIVAAPFDVAIALGPAFESVGSPQEVVYRENGRALAIWYVWVCRGFRGIGPDPRAGEQVGH
jgi:hypothetical protein